jgi:6-pyruvoyltetrahydropterin/6-carboxytetrahydropterin synthase
VLTLPVRNITVEELAPWFLERVRAAPGVAALNICRLRLKVSSGPGQWARAEWPGRGDIT